MKIIRNNIGSFIFFMSFAVGPLSIFLSPDNLTKTYVQTYSLANFLFSLFWTLFFLSENRVKNLFGVINLILVLLILINFSFNLNGTIWIYVFSILMIDLSSSQINDTRITLLNRLIPIFLLIMLLLDIINFNIFLYSRIVVSAIFNLIIYFSKYELKSLKIEHPTKFIVISFIFYSGTIILFSFILRDVPIKVYKILIVLFQIGLVLLLKELDYKTRHNSKGGGILFKLTAYVSLVLILIPSYFMLYYKDGRIFISILIYCISYTVLNYSKRYLKNE